MKPVLVLLSLASLTLSVGCGEGSGEFLRPEDPVVAPDAGADADPVEIVPVGPPMTGLHAVGNRIKNADGLDVVLHGVNRSGTEYRCVQAGGIFDGPSDLASIAAMAAWKINAVRVPLNEACWLGINGVPAVFAGDNYKQAIIGYVQNLRAFNIVPILELHWVGPGTLAADRQRPMPDADHTPAFWRDVASTFKADDGIILEPYNEPFPGDPADLTKPNRDTDGAWQCWRDGCQCQGWGEAPYQAAGMQALVDAKRETGARNLILLGGVQYSNALSQWLTYKPSDPLDNLGAAWHVYSYNMCIDPTCWEAAPAAVAAEVPLVSTELGQRDCCGSFLILECQNQPATGLMPWLDARQLGYLGWSWNAFGQCSPWVSNLDQGQPYSLIADYEGTPNSGGCASAPDQAAVDANGCVQQPLGQAFHDHLAKLAGP